MKRSVHRFFGVALVAAALLGVSSCLDTPDDIADPNIQLQKDIATIDNYMLTEGIYAYQEDEYTKIRFVIKKLGTKLPARTTATKITADYKLFTIPPASTTPVDQGQISGDQLGTLITAWQTMAMKLPVGTEAELYVPSLWAYGTQGNAKIAPNTPLLFHFDLINAEISSAEQNQFKSDTTAIRTYLEGKDYTDVVYDSTGIAYRITTQGGGLQPGWFHKVTFKAQYKLLTDDTRAVTDVLELKPQEDVTDSRPVDYIQGLMIGLQQLREGSKATFYIPSGLGFGVQGASNNAGTTVIPANSNIIVDIEVIAVSQ
ncbi:FKBP-type peptidyl-prolyl cis-trans isomerase [Fulvivirgaceae bacterium PWU5]|uniref:Peptidyl-prolyl cis-trans isomerase n=1 Tax=Dawidia cretensis TaxID=2782350 RepID=A0AAP2E0P2_9BACT|nr:FKBP-type peptidyl-prolyl cis-trans isomerase [Dawidia cretensis]MBT1709773.1 FKBP-type peptidyl-prolyl cis-trans isomerase [Dawidia cretensis]